MNANYAARRTRPVGSFHFRLMEYLDMDPNQTYRDMLDALDDRDDETARGLALVLKRWLANGGFYPQQDTPEAINTHTAEVLRRTADLA